MTTLRLYDVDNTLGLINMLYDNNYKYEYHHGLLLDDIRIEIVNLFKFYPKYDSGGVCIYYIEINEENKTFGLVSKWADKKYLRAEKLKQLNLW